MPHHDTLLAFDFGTRYIGVAVGQTITATANPLTTIRNHPSGVDWEAIGRLLDEWSPTAVIVGLPLNMDGSQQWISACAQRFARQIEGRYRCSVHLYDERLSTYEACKWRSPIDGRHSTHSIAAQIILQGWLANSARKPSSR